ncbi:hypothetical protein FJJ79_23460 [Escherichia coli]|nr:hypothetical protein [Escherichia coli]EFB1715314.1 hypothetical protein [Escherichia coli]EFB9837175.1 hypothetical protein [Escherichia coli]
MLASLVRGWKKQGMYSGACDRGRTTLVCQTLNSLRINQNACGSFPAIRQVTGRRPRGFSLFMKIFREPCPVSLQVNYMKNIKTGLL